AIAAHLSIIERITPPNTCPMLFECSGIMSSDVSCWLSRTVLIGRMTRPDVKSVDAARERSRVKRSDETRRARHRDARRAIVCGRLAERARERRARIVADR